MVYKLVSILIALLAFSPTVAQVNEAADCDLRIMFYSNRDHEPGLYSMKPDGSDVQQLITLDEITSDREFASFSSSPDGTQAAVSLYHRHREPGKETIDKHEIFLVNFEQQEATLLFDNAHYPLWSPDGKKLAFMSGDMYSHSIFIHDFESDTQSEINAVGLPGKRENFTKLEDWSPDGSKLAVSVIVYEPTMNYTIFAVDMHTETAYRITSPPLFAVTASWGNNDKLYFSDFTAEGYSMIAFDIPNIATQAIFSLEGILTFDGVASSTHLDVSTDGYVVFESRLDDIYVFDPETEAVTNITNTNTKMSNANDQESYPRWFCQPIV